MLTRRQIWQALRATDGNLAAAARSVGRSAQWLAYHVRRHGLRGRLQALRRAQVRDAKSLRKALAVQRARVRQAERARRMRALKQERGNVARAARRLGLGASTLHGWIARQRLGAAVAAMRPKRPAPAQERARLAELLRKHDGQQWKVQRELGVAKGTLRARLERHGLRERAAQLRLEASKPGPRPGVQGERYQRAERRERLRALLESVGWNVRRAVARSGVSNGRFHALMRELAVERPRALSPQLRLHRLIDALRLFRGNVARVGRSLKVPDAVVRAWCAEFDLDARDYR